MTAGDMYIIAGTGAIGSTGDGGPRHRAEINAPENLAVDAAGNVFVTEFYGNRVRVIAATTGTFYGQFDDRPATSTPWPAPGPRATPATGGRPPSAFEQPIGVAVDAFGNLVVGDYNGERVRVVAAATGTFYGIPMAAGDMYTVAGDGTQGTAGDGGPAVAAELSSPAGVAVDHRQRDLRRLGRQRDLGRGRLDRDVLRPADEAGDISTIAGGGTAAARRPAGRPCPPGAAALSVPLGVALAPDGSLLVSDTADNCVRALSGADRRKRVVSGSLSLRPGGPVRPGARAAAILGALVIATLVLSGAVRRRLRRRAGSATATSSAPRSGYLVYWDQDEEVDYYSRPTAPRASSWPRGT